MFGAMHLTLVLTFLLFCLPVQAATFNVTKTVDTADGVCDSDCSLREAVIAANNAGSETTHIINLPAGTYALSISGSNENEAQSGDLDFIEWITLKGAGAEQTIIDGASLATRDRVIDVLVGSISKIQGVTIQYGKTTSALEGGAGVKNAGTLSLFDCIIKDNVSEKSFGGGVSNETTLIVKNCQLSNNSAYLDGGGIRHNSGDRLTVSNSVFQSNSALNNGGAISANRGKVNILHSLFDTNTSSQFAGAIENGSNTQITGSTISNNTARWGGGGVRNIGGASALLVMNSTLSGNSISETGNGGGVYNENDRQLIFINSTVAYNTAARAVDGETDKGVGGGVYAEGGTNTLTQFKNTIVSNNTATSGANCSGAMRSLGNNLDNDGSCGFSETGDVSNKDPLLSVLSDLSGSNALPDNTFLKTHGLGFGSPAVDAGFSSPCPVVIDQREFCRKSEEDLLCDIGAFELNAKACEVTNLGISEVQYKNWWERQQLLYSVVVINDGPLPVIGFHLDVTLPGAMEIAFLAREDQQNTSFKCAGAGSVNCVVNSALAVDESMTLTATIVEPIVKGIFTAVFEVSTIGFEDAYPTNNTMSRKTNTVNDDDPEGDGDESTDDTASDETQSEEETVRKSSRGASHPFFLLLLALVGLRRGFRLSKSVRKHL